MGVNICPGCHNWIPYIITIFKIKLKPFYLCPQRYILNSTDNYQNNWSDFWEKAYNNLCRNSWAINNLHGNYIQADFRHPFPDLLIFKLILYLPFAPLLLSLIIHHLTEEEMNVTIVQTEWWVLQDLEFVMKFRSK